MEKYFRTDEYGKSLYIKNGKKLIVKTLEPMGKIGKIEYKITEKVDSGVYSIKFEFVPQENLRLEVFGFRLGIDCYMKSYPEWNDKFFPTALRCEKNGFWGVFVSPTRKMIAVASPSNIVSWKNEYNRTYGDVGHRIYTSCVEFVNSNRQPERHIPSPTSLRKGQKYIYKIAYKLVATPAEALDFIKEYSGIKVEYPSKIGVECGESLIYNKKEYVFDECGRYIISKGNEAEVRVYVRHDWFYYLQKAYLSACRCQQKAGTHTESWYGYFTKVFYAKIVKNEQLTKVLCEEFDDFLKYIIEGETYKQFTKKALPHRLQNVSCMISLLTDFYELTKNKKYLDIANDLADWLIKLQVKDGSYRSHGTHYTCVIYPAKSMLELALVEKTAGLDNRVNLHYQSALNAVKNLFELKDNIQTEGQMTFEDGMISCESLQLGFMALNVADEKLKKNFTSVAEEIYAKHFCLQQNFIPDCRSAGATYRFWEARYDVNFNSNMLNTPHGWTSWKNYASYYLYLLTGKLSYLEDLMKTICACMQCVNENGVLNWAFIADPCIVGNQIIPAKNLRGFDFKKVVIGEGYLPMISDWFRQNNKDMPMQYLRAFNKIAYYTDKHGSCDNDVHEHFKCLEECVFGKAFIHFDGDKCVTYNCKQNQNDFVTNDVYVDVIIARSDKYRTINFNGKDYKLSQGVQEIKL